MDRTNSRADVERITQVLAGLAFPAAKWQIVMQAEEYGADSATREQLWSLPTGSYPDLRAVLASLGLSTRPRTVPRSLPRYRPLPESQAAGRMRPVR